MEAGKEVVMRPTRFRVSEPADLRGGPQVTAEGVKRLQQALPDCDISY